MKKRKRSKPGKRVASSRAMKLAMTAAVLGTTVGVNVDKIYAADVTAPAEDIIVIGPGGGGGMPFANQQKIVVLLESIQNKIDANLLGTQQKIDEMAVASQNKIDVLLPAIQNKIDTRIDALQQKFGGDDIILE